MADRHRRIAVIIMVNLHHQLMVGPLDRRNNIKVGTMVALLNRHKITDNRAIVMDRLSESNITVDSMYIKNLPVGDLCKLGSRT